MKKPMSETAFIRKINSLNRKLYDSLVMVDDIGKHYPGTMPLFTKIRNAFTELSRFSKKYR